MTVRVAIVVLITTACAWSANAQTNAPSRSLCGSGWNLEIRQNTKTQTDVARPAFITWTNPGDGPTEVQAGIAVMAECDVHEGFVVAPYVDYQRNDAIAKAQDVVRAGGELEWILNPLRPSDIALGKEHHSGVILADTDFKRDAVRRSNGVTASVRYTHFYNGAGRWRPNLPFTVAGGAWEILYAPYVGFEVEQSITSDDTGEQGGVARLSEELRSFFYPAPSKLQGRVEFIASLAHRVDLWDTTGDDDDSHPLFTFDANVYPYKTDKAAVGFGLSFKAGENPDEGFASQHYWQFSVKLRLQ